MKVNRSTNHELNSQNFGIFNESQNVVSKIKTNEHVLTDAHCLLNWGLSTNWKKKTEKQKYTVRQIVGFVTSKPLDFISKESLKLYSINLDSVKKNLNLIDQNNNTEIAESFKNFGITKIGDRIFFFVMFRGYESEIYEIFEIKNNTCKRVLKVTGGGC